MNAQVQHKHDQNLKLAEAIKIAAAAHANQLDKGGFAYILHPMRVMENLNSTDPELCQIAILHDVIEDCIKFLLEQYHKKQDFDNYKEIVRNLIRQSTPEQKVELGLDVLRSWGFSERVLSGLRLMTKKSTDKGTEGYYSYIKRMFDNFDAIRVKMADLRDNMDASRMKGYTATDLERTVKYQVSFGMLKEAEQKFLAPH